MILLRAVVLGLTLTGILLLTAGVAETLHGWFRCLGLGCFLLAVVYGFMGWPRRG